jgi:hypothetical protein
MNAAKQPAAGGQDEAAMAALRNQVANSDAALQTMMVRSQVFSHFVQFLLPRAYLAVAFLYPLQLIMPLLAPLPDIIAL